MKLIVSHVIEMIIGVILFAFSMTFLLSNESTLNRLIATVNDLTIEDINVYQQYSNPNRNLITSEELHAIVMGYREYPITIDGTTIDMDGTEYENYILLIKNGNYSKNYNYDTERCIRSVNYTYNGT